MKKQHISRYLRQTMIEGFDQSKLSDARVLVCGIGGLGSAVTFYLAAAGVGEIIMVDRDKVEETDLNRQILHFTHDIGRYKVVSAYDKLREFNPEIKLNPIPANLNENLLRNLPHPDVIVDALDNLSTRFILNEFAVNNNIPLVHAAVEGFEGRITTILPHRTACLACIYQGVPSPRTFPIVGVTAGLLGVIEATEVIKLLTHMGQLLLNKLLFIDLQSWDFDIINIEADPSCAVCGANGRKR